MRAKVFFENAYIVHEAYSTSSTGVYSNFSFYGGPPLPGLDIPDMDLTFLKDKCYLCLSNATSLIGIETGEFKSKMKLTFNTQFIDDSRLPQLVCEDCMNILQKSFKINNNLMNASLIYQKLLKEDDIRKNGNTILIDDDENANEIENTISSPKTKEVSCQTDEVLTTEIQTDPYQEINPMDFVAVVETPQSPPMQKCPICGNAFRTFQGVCSHFKTHYKIRPYICNGCNSVQSKLSELVLHLMHSTCSRQTLLN